MQLSWEQSPNRLHSLAQTQQEISHLELVAEKYRSIFENALDGIFQTTIDGEYLSFNPTLARICGYASPEELLLAQPVLR